MPAELYCASEPGGNNGSPQGIIVGGSKPLHRFIKGQPKIVGIVVLILGFSSFIVSIVIMTDYNGFLLGTLFIICGILYILTEHSPTKRRVTISLALSIVNILVACWLVMSMVPNLSYAHYRHVEFNDDNGTYFSSDEDMQMSLEIIFLIYTIVGDIIVIVMACLAVSALRSTKSQAIVLMTTTPAATPVE